METIPEEFTPFQHENLEYINGSLSLARQQKQLQTLEGTMAATVIYTNLIEYLSSDLLRNIQHMISLLAYHAFSGIFFVKSPSSKSKQAPLTLGQLTSALGEYDFPDSQELLRYLRKFGETRNAIFHRLMKISQEELKNGLVDKQFSELHDAAEEILNKYNVITVGIGNIWTAAARKSGGVTTAK